MKEINLSEGSILKNIIRFSLPYLLSCFLQAFYGLADLFIAGQFNGSSTISAVSIGSQVMHMLTVIIVGLAMGTTVAIGHSIGSNENQKIKDIIGNTGILFTGLSILLTIILLLNTGNITDILSTPTQARTETISYLSITLGGTIFITAYNCLSSIFRGLGDTKTPMIFIAVSGAINIILDYVLIGGFRLGATGAAIATVTSQAISVILLLIYAVAKIPAFKLSKNNFAVSQGILINIIKIGFPIACQDGFIQVAFLVITAIANMRGVEAAAAVGIVEKLISFMFLVPSAMLSSVSAIAAQNAGAKKHDRSKKTLHYGITICIFTGIFFTIICELFAENIVELFANKEPMVVTMGSQYLRSYVFDCIVAGIHFCYSGFFCAYEKSYLSFIHNIISILLVRIPGAYFASAMYPATLLPMGMAAPLGSALSAIICLIAYFIFFRRIRE